MILLNSPPYVRAYHPHPLTLPMNPLPKPSLRIPSLCDTPYHGVKIWGHSCLYEIFPNFFIISISPLPLIFNNPFRRGGGIL